MKRLLGLALGSLLAAVVGCAAPTSEDPNSSASELQQDSNVRLLSASITQGCSSCFGLEAKVVVRDLDFNKSVSLVYTIDGSTTEHEAALHYAASAGPGREIWALSSSSLGFVDEGARVHVRAKYVVNGQTYMDGETSLTRNTTALGAGSNVALLRSWSAQSHLYQNIMGDVAVRNIGYEKKVTVVYTTDHWRSTKTVAAYFSQGAADPNGVELWRFMIPEPQVSVEAAISYTVNGETYWDNNFSQNYAITF